MSQAILITGADGFLGGKLIKRILQDTDWNILGLTMSMDLPPRMMERESIPESDRLSFMRNDVFLDSETQVTRVCGAVHLAFSRRMQPAKDIASSIDFSAAVFRRLAALHVDRVIYLSSQGVYGNTEEIRTEETPVAPETQYTMAKYAAEVLFRDVLKETPHHTILRLDPVTQSQNVIQGLVKSAKEGEIRLKGGKQVFSFIDAEDAASAILAMLQSQGEWAPVYNVGWNRNRHTLTELAETVADCAVHCGYDRPVIHLEENDTSLWAGMDSSCFMWQTGWKPEKSLEQSLQMMMHV